MKKTKQNFTHILGVMLWYVVFLGFIHNYDKDGYF